ncbi:MAG: DUF3108 domain-containing protein [Pseudomonadota bacterium]|nr:DUF3108 domain-containing protein [Pseudomonadota bacterium]
MTLLRALPLLLVLLAGISRADAETMPFSPFTAHYRGEANGMSVQDLGTRTLSSLGQERYRIEYRAKAMIYSLQETSEFLWENGQPRPLHYDSSRGTFLKKRESQIDFNWTTGQGRYVHKKKAGKFTLSDGLQDPLSSTLLLALQVQAGQSTIRFREAKGNDQDLRVFSLLGTPELETESGRIKTFHLKRQHDDKKRHTEIWLHHDYPFIPVKVEQTDDGDRFLLELTRFHIH